MMIDVQGRGRAWAGYLCFSCRDRFRGSSSRAEDWGSNSQGRIKKILRSKYLLLLKHLKIVSGFNYLRQE